MHHDRALEAVVRSLVPALWAAEDQKLNSLQGNELFRRSSILGPLNSLHAATAYQMPATPGSATAAKGATLNELSEGAERRQQQSDADGTVTTLWRSGDEFREMFADLTQHDGLGEECSPPPHWRRAPLTDELHFPVEGTSMTALKAFRQMGRPDIDDYDGGHY